MSTDLGMPGRATGDGVNGDSPAYGPAGTAGVPRVAEGEKLTKKDFTSDQEVRWCPGCGDYAILAGVQSLMPELGLRRENMVFVSGIGCAARFPYYMDTYGMHSIHGRAPAIATGLAVARPDLTVMVVTGDGDALSIGGNHLIHALRRNVNITVLLHNNKIYGLTKGQYSPTSPLGQVSKSSPLGSVDVPFHPLSLALGSEASFVARTMDSDRTHLQATLKAAIEHRGASFVEIFQNCPIFNDGAFQLLKDAESAAARVVWLEHGQPIRVGDDRVVVRGEYGGVQVMGAAEAQAAGLEPLVHDATVEDPTVQFALSRLEDASMTHIPMGIFRSVERAAYDDAVREQVAAARAGAGHPQERLVPSEDELSRLLQGRDTWTIG